MKDHDGHSVSASYDSNLWNLTTCTILVFGTFCETKNWLLPHYVEFLTFNPKKIQRCEKKWSNGKLKKNKNGTRITAWAALPAVWQANKQTKQRQQKHVLFRCDTTNSGHIGIREFQDLCQEFGIEEVVRGDIYCYWTYIGIDIEQWAGHWQWRACLYE